MTQRQVVPCVLGLLILTGIARAQEVIFDPANTLRNAVTAGLKDEMVNVLLDEVDQLERMARRLSALTDLRKYATEEIPEWRIHLFQFEQFLFANSFNAALNYGDGAGAAFDEVARQRLPRPDVDAVLALADARAADAVRRQLATLDLADSAIIIGTDQTGQLRFNGRKEHEAIDRLQDDVIDGSDDRSTAAVLDAISGADLIRGR